MRLDSAFPLTKIRLGPYELLGVFPQCGAPTCWGTGAMDNVAAPEAAEPTATTAKGGLVSLLYSAS